jgi:amino acid transporter/nucleotide-binding universal stress UspA family protein
MNSTNAHSNSGTQVTLSRTLNLFSITMIGVGGMIGAGIFALTGTAAGAAGPALIVAFILNGIVTTFTALSYAELGSAFPEAGGGYLWVKEGLGGLQGFFAGWMSWFAHAAAGSLYALTFGHFLTEFWHMAGLPSIGLANNTMSLIFMSLIIIVFTYLNYQGVSETGSIGNYITMTKLLILFLFVIFGIGAMLGTPNWEASFTENFMPNGISGILVAMGLTFVAFEGYEIIAQSGEEAIDPKRNIPKSIFLAIGICVLIYILVGITAIGAIQPPEGMTNYDYLGSKGEIAIIEVAGQTFPLGIGRIVLLISGLVSTMSALNATTYSSSRVSFAMGRDHNLPALFAQIDPKHHTPHWAVIISGALMIIMGVSLPIAHVAAAADIMFLLLFLQVNFAIIALRKKRPDMDRGFIVPFMPVIPIIAIILNSLLAVHLFTFSPIAWYFVGAWMLIGFIAYSGYFSKIEAMEKPKEILMEEVLVSRKYSVTVPVMSEKHAEVMGDFGSIIAKHNNGEVLAMHVIQVPSQLTLSEGRIFLKERRPFLEAVIDQAKQRDVHVHTLMRLGRSVADAIQKTVFENASDLLLLGAPGSEKDSTKYGSVLHPLLNDPPCDVAVVKYREKCPIKRIIVPIGGGVNSRLAVRLATQFGYSAEDEPAEIILLNVIPENAGENQKVRASQIIHRSREGFDYPKFTETLIEGSSIVNTVLNFAKGNETTPAADLIVIGATEERMFENLLMGSIAEKISNNASTTVITVKRRSSRLRSFLRSTVIPSEPKK